MEEKINLMVSTDYNLDDFKNLEENNPHIHLRPYKQKSFLGKSFIIFGLNAIFWFSKGYFTKMGENFADAHFEIYKKLKNGITHKAFKNGKNSNSTTIGFQIDSNNFPRINVYLRPSNEKDTIESFDEINEVYNDILKIFKDKDKEIKEITISLDCQGNITDFFYTTKNGNLFIAKDKVI